MKCHRYSIQVKFDYSIYTIPWIIVLTLRTLREFLFGNVRGLYAQNDASSLKILNTVHEYTPKCLSA